MRGSWLRINQDGHSDDIPEKNLWFAVIERAFNDYCNFFDKTIMSKDGRLGSYHFIAPRKTDNFCVKAIYELDRLRWFLFSREKEEFNLEYLAEQLYEDGEGELDRIRKEAKKKFLECFENSKDLESLSPLISYIYEYIPDLIRKP